LYRPARAEACGINSLESIPGLLKRLQIRVQATLASEFGSLELILGLLKLYQITQATLDSGIVSLESIPGLLKRLQIGAQATIQGSPAYCFSVFLFVQHKSLSKKIGVACGSARLMGCYYLAHRRFSARHKEVFPTELTSDEEMERGLGEW
jgi:hypothetical protein